MNIFNQPFPGQEFHQLLADWRTESAVKKIHFMGQEGYALLSYQAVKDAFQDSVNFPPYLSYQFDPEPSVGRTLISAQEPEHTISRNLSMPAFKLQAIAHYGTDWIRDLCNELIDELEPSCDLNNDFTKRLSILVIIRMLGLPREDEAQLHEWGSGILAYQKSKEFSQECGRQFGEYLRPVIDDRRRNPHNDIISQLIDAEYEGHKFSTDDIISHIRLLVPTGAETTYLALGNSIYGLLSHEGLWQRVLENPDLIEAATEEGFRWEAPVSMLPRMTGPKAFEFHGTLMEPNSVALFGIGSAHRDASVFPDPEYFSLDRKEKTLLLTFGPGVKNCPGMHLARQEIQIALGCLLERLKSPVLLRDVPPEGSILRTPPVIPVAWGG